MTWITLGAWLLTLAILALVAEVVAAYRRYGRTGLYRQGQLWVGKDPSVQLRFRLKEGQKAIKRAMASKGVLNTGHLRRRK